MSIQNCRQGISLSAMLQNNQEYRRKRWATRSSVRSFARTAHSFACSALLALLAHSAALIHSLPRSLTHSLACGKVNDWIAIFDLFFLFWNLDHSKLGLTPRLPLRGLEWFRRSFQRQCRRLSSKSSFCGVQWRERPYKRR